METIKQFFSKTNNRESDDEDICDEESDYESVEEDENILEFIENDKKIEYEDGKREIYHISLSKLFNLLDNEDINFSKLNRVIDKERVESAFQNFSINQSDPIILANIEGKAGFDILDGQHRLTFLKKNRERFNGNEKLVLDIRYLENEEEYGKLLDIINNRMNFSKSQLNKYLLLGVKEGLKEKLENKRLGKDIYGKQRPFIRWDELQDALVNTKTYKDSDNKVEDILGKLVKLNHHISRNKDIYEKYIGKSKTILKKAFDMHLFLGIDKKYKIIKMIDEM